MALANIRDYLIRHLDSLAKTVFYISAVLTLVGYESQFFGWGQKYVFPLLQANWIPLWLFTLSFATIALWVWTTRLNQKFISGFEDDFRSDIRDNWDFVAPWRIAEKGQLLVAGGTGLEEDAGGISKAGAHWENYALSLQARIMNECLGVIVKARDLNNYYMFQIRKDRIRPHRRTEIPVVEARPQGLIFAESSEEKRREPLFQPVSFAVGWQTDFPEIPLDPLLDGWFQLKIVVNGTSVKLFIDNELVHHEDTFFNIPAGKVGFRNHGSESALVKNVKVTLSP